MHISRDITPRHLDLLKARRESNINAIAQSLTKPGARPATLGVFQKRNHCGGAEGKAKNLREMVDAIATAGTQGVQILAMPEMALQGYFTPVSGTVEEAKRANRELADVVGKSESLAQMQNAARAAGVVVAFGFSERDGEDIYNSIGVIDADGAWLGVRRKNPLYPWAYELECFREPHPSLRSCVFTTRYARIGLSDCFDGEFPETIRRMSLDGAQVLLWCNAACGSNTNGTSHRINHAGSHAQANGLWVAVANCVAPNASGTSCIIAPTGEPLVILTPNDEELGVAQANLEWSTDWAIWRDRLWPKV